MTQPLLLQKSKSDLAADVASNSLDVVPSATNGEVSILEEVPSAMGGATESPSQESPQTDDRPDRIATALARAAEARKRGETSPVPVAVSLAVSEERSPKKEELSSMEAFQRGLQVGVALTRLQAVLRSPKRHLLHDWRREAQKAAHVEHVKATQDEVEGNLTLTLTLTRMEGHPGRGRGECSRK